MGLTDAGLTVERDDGVATDLPPTISSTPTPSFIEGTGSTYDFTANVSDDGRSAVTYSLTNVLPNGLTLNTSTGILTYDGIGIPSVSQHQLTATDAVGSAQSDSFDISIVSAIVVVDGILNVSAGTASAQVHLGWTRPTTNADASFLGDLRSFKIYVGTSTGNYDLINGLDTFTTLQKGATESLITGLTDAVTYYFAVSAVDAFGNEGAKSTELSATAAIPSTPSRSYTDITGTTTISVAGDYRLTASFSGKITISVDDVYLFGNGETITFDTDTGIETTGTRDNIEIDSVTFIHTGGAALGNIRFGGFGSITNCKVHDCTLHVRNGVTSGIRFYTETATATGCRFYGNTCTIDLINYSFGGAAYLVWGGSGFKSYNNTITINNAGRNGGYWLVGSGNEIWADDFKSLNGVTDPAGAVNSFVTAFGGSNSYIHDNLMDNSLADAGRVVHGDAVVNWLILHNDIKIGTGGRGTSVRGASFNAADNFVVGYNTFDGGGRGISAAMRWGGWEAKYVYVPNDMYAYENTVTNADGSGFQLYEAWTGMLSTWNNTFNGINSPNETGQPLADYGNWDTNNDVISGTIEVRVDPAPNVWRVNGSFVVGQIVGAGGSDHITFDDTTWHGFDGNADTPAAPTALTEIV